MLKYVLISLLFLVQGLLADTTQYVPASTHPLGLGWALFATILLAALLLVACLTSSQQDYAPMVFVGSAILLGLFILIIALIPKLQVGAPIAPTPIAIDWTWYPRIVFVSFTTIFSGLAAMIATSIYAFTPVYAIPLDIKRK